VLGGFVIGVIALGVALVVFVAKRRWVRGIVTLWRRVLRRLYRRRGTRWGALTWFCTYFCTF